MGAASLELGRSDGERANIGSGTHHVHLGAYLVLSL